MIGASILVVALAGVVLGLWIGLRIGTTRTRDALKKARYDEAIKVLIAFVQDPAPMQDQLDQRIRATEILTAHRAADTKE